MVFPTTPVLDDFNRADQGPPPSSSWTDGFLAINGLAVISNQCGAPANFGNSYWNPATFGPDCEVFATVAAHSSFPKVWARLKEPGSDTVDGYCLSASSTDWTFFRVDNGVLTQIGAALTGVGCANGDQVGLRIVGSKLTAYKNGVLVGTETDATYPAAGFIGLNGQTSAIRWDDFGGGAYVAPLIPALDFVPMAVGG